VLGVHYQPKYYRLAAADGDWYIALAAEFLVRSIINQNRRNSWLLVANTYEFKNLRPAS
jgi:hypothetical protein